MILSHPVLIAFIAPWLHLAYRGSCLGLRSCSCLRPFCKLVVVTIGNEVLICANDSTLAHCLVSQPRLWCHRHLHHSFTVLPTLRRSLRPGSPLLHSTLPCLPHSQWLPHLYQRLLFSYMKDPSGVTLEYTLLNRGPSLSPTRPPASATPTCSMLRLTTCTTVGSSPYVGFDRMIWALSPNLIYWKKKKN